MENESCSSGKFSRTHNTGVTAGNAKNDGGNKFQPETFEDRTIFMSMYSDIDWRKEGNKEDCMSNSSDVTAYARRRTWVIPRTGIGRKCYGTHTNKPNAFRNHAAGLMMMKVLRKRTPSIPTNKCVVPRRGS